MEKGIDVALVTAMLSNAYSNAYSNAFDVAILVGGDQDYTQAVEEVRRAGKRVEIAFFEYATGKEFKYSGDSFLSLDEKIDQIRLKSAEELHRQE